MARVRNGYGFVVLVLVIAYFAVKPAQPALVALLGLVNIAAIEYGVRRMRPERAGAWRLIEATLALLAAGDALFVVLDNSGPDPVPYPAAPDIFYLAAYLPLTVGLLWLGRPLSPYSDQTTLIDSISVTLAGSLVVWIVIVRPALEAQALSPAARIAAVGAWVGYIAVFSVSIRVILSWQRNIAVSLLGAAIFVFLVSELFYGQQLVRGTWTTGSVVDLGYFAFSALCGAAALHPSMRDLATAAHARHNLSPGRLTLVAVALLAAPTALLVEATRGAVTTGIAIAVVAALVSVLMVIRLAMTGRAYRRRTAREHAARVAAQAMVTAVTAEEVVAGTQAALRRVASDRGPVRVELVRPYGAVAGPAAGPAQVVRPLEGTNAALAYTGSSPYELHELRDLLSSLADQAALALTRIELMEQGRVEERERYFRTLVLTSTDVILISRDGRIGYATPSATAMFGRTVVDESFDDLVRPSPEAAHAPEQLRVDAGERAHWPDTVLDGAEGVVRCRSGEELTVLVHRRDLTGDPTVQGVVTTLRDVTEERALKRDLAYRASHDDMTGLANSRAWGEVITSEGERRRRPGEGIGVIFVDLDNFKQINDRFGHPVGDQVLAEVARRIQECVRGGDVAARVGGDEFAALLRGLSSVDDARVVAQRLAAELARPTVIDGDVVECQASIGLAYTEEREQIRALVRQADTALYAAKEQGKGRWAEYNAKQWRPQRRTHNGDGGGPSGAEAEGRTIR